LGTEGSRARWFGDIRVKAAVGGGWLGVALFGVEPWRIAAGLAISAVALVVLPPCEEAGQQLKRWVREAMRRKRSRPLQPLSHSFRQRSREAGRGGDVVQRRLPDALQRAELAQQRSLPLRPDAGDGVQG